MKTALSTISEKVTKNWKWLLLFLFLPSLNACTPSVGLIIPFALEVNNRDFYTEVPHLIVFLTFTLLNFGLFLFLVERIKKYFQNHIIQLQIILCYFAYESIISVWMLLDYEWFHWHGIFDVDRWLPFTLNYQIAMLPIKLKIDSSPIFPSIGQIIWLATIFTFSLFLEKIIKLITRK